MKFVTLRNISIIFIAVFALFILIQWNASGDGSWGITPDFLLFVGLILAYIVFWTAGNFYYLKKYQKSDKKLVSWLLNIPALVIGISVVVWILSIHPGHAAFTLQAVDEEEHPIEGVEVVFRHVSVKETEITDEQGKAEWWDRYYREVKYQANKPGYIPVRGYITLTGPRPGIWPFRRLQPWNATTQIVLKKDTIIPKQ